MKAIMLTSFVTSNHIETQLKLLLICMECVSGVSQLLHSRFFEIAEECGEYHTALVSPNEDEVIKLSYKQLSKCAQELSEILKDFEVTLNSISMFLRNKVKEDEVVGIFSDGRAEDILGILGILHSKAAFVPIQPSLPLSHNIHILESLQLRICVLPRSLWFKGHQFIDEMSNRGITLVLIDTDLEDNFSFVNSPPSTFKLNLF